MNLGEMISKGAVVAGSQKELAAALGIAQTHLSNAKKGERGLPLDACFELAQILGIDPACVTAASALVTEKDERKRAIFAPFVMDTAINAATRIAQSANSEWRRGWDSNPR